MSRKVVHTRPTRPITDFLGQGPAYRELASKIRKVQRSGTRCILVQGETGTGKELVARSLHFGGPRAKAPFIPLNCATIPLELAESTFFGHVQGAFTGATTGHKGYFELAHGGTLFLDEIGDMPPVLQVKMLRVLEDQTIMKVGSQRVQQLDVKIIAATNADLRRNMEARLFRQDLYYRLARFIIQVPPLRQRKEDIPLLANHFAKHLAAELDCAPPRIGRRAMAMLQAYPYFGNVRELRNIIEHALVECEGGVIRSAHLHFQGLEPAKPNAAGQELRLPPARRSFGVHAPGIPRTSLPPDRIESIMITGALVQERGNVAAAAQLLNLPTDLVQRTARHLPPLPFDPGELSDEERIIAFLQTGGRINNTKCRKLLSIDLNRASYLLKKLTRQGILRKEKGGRWSSYRLTAAGANGLPIETTNSQFNANWQTDATNYR